MNLELIKNMKSVKGRGKYDYNSIFVKGIREKDNAQMEGTISSVVTEIKEGDTYNKSIITPNLIFKCAAGWFPVAYGVRWEFSSQTDQDKYNIYKSYDSRHDFIQSTKFNRLQIVMFDRSGNPLKGFENIYEAMKFLRDAHKKKPDYRTIISIARKNSKNENIWKSSKSDTAFGFQWMFYEDAIK